MCGGGGDIIDNTLGSIQDFASNTAGSVRDTAMAILMPLFGKPDSSGGFAFRDTGPRKQTSGVAQSYTDALAASTSGLSASVGQGLLNSAGSGKGTLG